MNKAKALFLVTSDDFADFGEVGLEAADGAVCELLSMLVLHPSHIYVHDLDSHNSSKAQETPPTV